MEKAIYQGHGQIESYNLNNALLGIVSHEQRHVNFNKYIASLNNKEVKQDVKITIQYKNGYPVPVNAYTKANFKKKTPDKEEEFLKLLSLNFKISNIKKKLNNANEENKIKYLIELKQYEDELKKIKNNIFSQDSVDTLFSFKKDYAKFLGIFDFQKFNLPPVSTTNPLISAYRVHSKLQDRYRSDELHGTVAESHIKNRNDYLNFLVNSWEELYSKFSRFNSYIKNFAIHFNKLEISDLENASFEATVPDKTLKESEYTEYTVKVSKTAKSFTVYSREFYDVYTDLNLSGTIKINGVAVTIEPGDSLYDIVQKINWGEDSNYNGVLDYNLGEDVNNNQQLDGGSIAHGVYAYIENNRLYLKNLDTGDKAIVLTDDNDILRNFEIIKDNPFNDSTYFPNILQYGENAVVYINDKKITSQSNIVTYKNLTLNLKKENSSQVVVIKHNTEKAFNDIKNFVGEYNKVITMLNDKLKDENFTNSLVALLLKRDMKVAMFSDVEDNVDIRDAGIDLKNSKNYLKELNIDNSSSKKFNNSIEKALYSTGILSNDDETLVINEDKLRKAIQNNPELVENLFFANNGVIGRLKNFLSKVVDKTDGMIRNEIGQLSSDELREIKNFFIKESVLTYFYEQKLATLNEIIK